MRPDIRIDPVTRYVHIDYEIAADAPDAVEVRCEVSDDGGANWGPAAVWQHMSDTARQLVPDKDWDDGALRGRLTERSAAGLVRSLVWNPFSLTPAQATVQFRLAVGAAGREICSEEWQIELENSDIIVLDDWARVVQKWLVSEDPEPGQAKWWVKRGQQGERGPACGISLEVGEKGVELSPLTYPLDLRGIYAVFVQLPPKLGAIELRLSGDERTENFRSSRVGEEVLWRWTDMTRQHLVIKQPYSTVDEYEDLYRAHLDRVRLVPLGEEQASRLDERWLDAGDRRTVVGYNEPYSWAFNEKVESNLKHREPLLAFAAARVDLIDIQIGRAGCRMVEETRVGSQLLESTFGDPVRGEVPTTSNVGRMQQFTNTLGTQLRYARELGMTPVANLGATNCYVGTPLEADFSREHPEWRDGGRLRYEVPEVRQFVLSLLEEALEIGADKLSIDWCRYPHSVRSAETVNQFFRELRDLADRWGTRRGARVDLMTRFPARGVPGWQYMDYQTWAREGLIDSLCPSNIQGRHMHFELAEYLDAVAGTPTRLLPCVDALHWGLTMPGMWLQRILHCYEQGADGVYIYQCDAPVLGGPETRRYVSIAGSAAALRGWSEREAAEQKRYSKGIYLNAPHEGKYHPWGRLRVWVEGLAPGEVELYVDGELMSSYAGPPYTLTSEEHEDDGTIPSGRHRLKVRARDGSDWLEREFEVEFA